MLKIILCDDDAFTLRLLSTLLDKAIAVSGVQARVVCVSTSAEELLRFVRSSGQSHLYFLDYDLGKQALNGIDLVRQIYTLEPEGKIVFVTSHGEKGMEILRSGVRPFGFMEKSVDQQQMVREYVHYLLLAQRSQPQPEPEPVISLPLGIDETVQIPLWEITYVDSVKTVAHSICYHTLDGSQITVRDTIDHAQQLLGLEFVRCHRSVLANRRHILSCRNGMVQLSNGVQVACALGRRQAILQLLEQGGSVHD